MKLIKNLYPIILKTTHSRNYIQRKKKISFPEKSDTTHSKIIDFSKQQHGTKNTKTNPTAIAVSLIHI